VLSFRRQLSHLGRTTPAPLRSAGRIGGYAPRSTPAYGRQAPGRAPAARRAAAPAELGRQRRANILLVFLALAAFFGAGALSSGSSLVLAAFVVSLALLAGYVLLLAQMAKVEEERANRSAWSRQRAA
jgi:hypothetical protein